jgi:hypothetical protein
MDKIEEEKKEDNFEPVRERKSRQMLKIENVECVKPQAIIRNRLHKTMSDRAYREVLRELFVKADIDRDNKLD